jgi:2-isopropylmalate synthase
VLEQDQGLKLPKKLQADFSRHVQHLADELGRELNAADIWQVFREAYFVKVANRRFRLVDFEERRASDGDRIFTGTIEVGGREQSDSGRGKGLISSVLATLEDEFGLKLEVLDYTEHALGAGTDARAATYLECSTADGKTVWGVGIDEDVATASVRAILSAANSAVREMG